MKNGLVIVEKRQKSAGTDSPDAHVAAATMGDLPSLPDATAVCFNAQTKAGLLPYVK